MAGTSKTLGGPKALPEGPAMTQEYRPRYLTPVGRRPASTSPTNQKLNGSGMTGVQRLFRTCDRKDWLEA
jgi:hypothetical protein